MFNNIDLEELTMTKDVTDYDRNFTRFLKISFDKSVKDKVRKFEDRLVELDLEV